MNVPSRINFHLTRLHFWIAVFLLSGCAVPPPDTVDEPQFGKAVRAALLAQELPVFNPPKSPLATYMELQQSIESQQKAKPATTNTNRSSLNNTTRPLGQ